jgi:hypothetical protein
MAEPAFVFGEANVYILPIVRNNFNDIFAYDECDRSAVFRAALQQARGLDRNEPKLGMPRSSEFG